MPLNDLSAAETGSASSPDGGRLGISLVIPCYNDEAGISALHRRCTSVLSGLFGSSYEIILVNDGSGDRTWDGIKSLATSDPHVVGLDLSRNFGHQNALTAGLEIARGDLIFTIDSDLQDPPELLPDMIAVLDQGADVVFGQRMTREGERWTVRFTAASFYRLMTRISHVEIPEDTGDFRLMRRQVLDSLKMMPEASLFIRGMVRWLGFKQVAFPYHRSRRLTGRSGYSFVRRLRLALNAITAFSMMPLRLAFYISLVFSLLSILMAIWVIYSKFSYDITPGWASLMLVISIVGSAQFFILGIIGEYVGRLFIESKRRPRFVVREVFANAEGALPADPLRFPGMPAIGQARSL